MDIYRIETGNEYDYVCANTVIEALQTYCHGNNFSLIDFEATDEIVKIPETEWDGYTVKQEGGGEITFAEYMKTVVEPELFASTAYHWDD